MKPPPPSSAVAPEAAASDKARVHDAPLIAVGRVLAEHGHYGLIWVDDDLSVTACYGRIVSFVSVGSEIVNELPALIGLEADIRALKNNPDSALEVPAISIVSKDGATPRLNVVVLWMQEQRSFLCFVMRAGAGSDIEIGLAQQMRGRLIAEAELQLKTKELARANKDLEDYAFIISHDLRSPMRALHYQIDDLENELGPDLAVSASERFQKLRDQSKRMSNMLSALLDYSSVGNKQEVISTVDTRAVVQSIVSSLNVTPATKINVAGDWPTFATLEQPLDMVLRNLIGNAIKHHGGGEVAISIQGEDHASHFVFEVSDNGPGILPEHRTAVFLPFRTLKGSNSHDVQGMGLAIVQRLVTMVGGEISIDGREGGQSGAVFRVVWPKSSRA